MARKKKKRKQRRSEKRAAAPSIPAPAESSVVAPDLPPAAVQEPAPTPPPAEDDVDRVVAESVEDLDASIDDANESYDSLVAAVAGIEDDEAHPSRSDRRGPEAREDVEEVVDLDDDVEPTSVQRLIAEVGRAPADEVRTDDFDDDVPVIDLDDDLPPAAPRRQPAAAAAVSPDVSRLAQAAAAGAPADDEPPPVPIDLFGDISTPEARARLLAEALAHAEHKEARYRVPLADTRRVARWKSAIAALLLLIAATVAVAPPAWVRPEQPAQLSDAARARGLRLALLLQAHQVEAYRVRTQELPASLDDLPMTLAGVTYARSGRSYQLVAFTPSGEPIVYDAADPAPLFRALEAVLATVAAP